jgi:hypothetical protein
MFPIHEASKCLFALPFVACLCLPRSDVEVVKEERSAPSTAVENPLSFAVGTWRTEGTQFWTDGTWVEHKGIVEARLAKDGLTLERVFWSSFANGASLGGRSVHVFDPIALTWSGRWTPTLGTWDATPSFGRFEELKDGETGYIEVARGKDAGGAFESTTRFFGVTPEGYGVKTDLVYDSGVVSKNNWNIRFVRIPAEPARESEADNKDPVEATATPPAKVEGTLAFMLGRWLAEGTLQLPDGSEVVHKSYVDARLADDGLTIEREFWGALGSGQALRGVSTYTPTAEDGVWDVLWNPTGAPAAGAARGSFEADEFVEVQTQELPTGRSMQRTRVFDITQASYRVQTDVLPPVGAPLVGVWTVRFRRIG